MILRITSEALERKLAALLGTRPKAALEFEPSLDLRQPAAQRLIRLLWFFGKLFDTEATQPPPLVLRELEQAVIVSFLAANRHPTVQDCRCSRSIPRLAMSGSRRNSSRRTGANPSASTGSWKSPPSAHACCFVHSGSIAAVPRWSLPSRSGSIRPAGCWRSPRRPLPPSPMPAASTAPAISRAPTARRSANSLRRPSGARSNFCPAPWSGGVANSARRANHWNLVKPCDEKYSALPKPQIRSITRPARATIRDVSRSSRNVERVAMDACGVRCVCTGRKRGSVRRSRVVLAPRPWRYVGESRQRGQERPLPRGEHV